MRVAGIGFRKEATIEAVLAAIDAALAAHGLSRVDLDLIAAHEAKSSETAFGAAYLLGKTLVVVPASAVKNMPTPTRSDRVVELFGAGSLAEAVALAAAGKGARLLGPRTATPLATCAIAEGQAP
jgi:cobalt-precorrin 5A hydrolase